MWGCRVGQAYINRCAVWSAGLCKFTLIVVLQIRCRVGQAYFTRCAVWDVGLSKFTLIVVLCEYTGLGKLTLLVVLCGVHGCVSSHYSLCCVWCRVV